jgi:hypothetical protein
VDVDIAQTRKEEMVAPGTINEWQGPHGCWHATTKQGIGAHNEHDTDNRSSIGNDIGVLAALSQDLESVDGVRSVDWITKVRGVIGDKPVFFNGVDVAIYSTPYLFAAHTAIDNALPELRTHDDRLPEIKEGDVQRDWARLWQVRADSRLES